MNLVKGQEIEPLYYENGLFYLCKYELAKNVLMSETQQLCLLTTLLLV